MDWSIDFMKPEINERCTYLKAKRFCGKGGAGEQAWPIVSMSCIYSVIGSSTNKNHGSSSATCESMTYCEHNLERSG